MKNTSVLALVAGGDLMYRSDNFVSLYGFLQGYIVCCLMYFIICFPIAMLGQWLERRSKARPRAKVIPGMYFIICFPIAMLGQWLERRSKARPRAKVIPGVTDAAGSSPEGAVRPATAGKEA